ncbi:MAG TPA: hypothetical protein VEB70_11070 [Noviherbaspirillum sp.]|nr:hypothetical protein [Noviherbaspirillum sp.]
MPQVRLIRLPLAAGNEAVEIERLYIWMALQQGFGEHAELLAADRFDRGKQLVEELEDLDGLGQLMAERDCAEVGALLEVQLDLVMFEPAHAHKYSRRTDKPDHKGKYGNARKAERQTAPLHVNPGEVLLE